MTGRQAVRWPRVPSPRLLSLLVPALLALFAYRTSVTFELVGDAVPLIEQNPLLRDIRNIGAMATHDYFWSPAGESIGYWRPLTKVSWLLETVVGGGRPWVYQAAQLAWLAAAVAGVAALALAVGLGPLPAALAASVYALHPATIEPAALVMARSDVACAAASLWAVVAWLRWRAGGGGWALAAHTAALVLAFGSKETALVLLPVLAAWSVPGLRPSGSRFLARHLAPVTAVAALYLLLRWRFLGATAGAPLAPDLLRLFVGIGAFLRGVVPLGFATGIRNLTLAEAGSAAQLAAAGAAWLAAALFATLAWRRWREGLVLLAWVFGALAVVLVVGPMRVPGAAGRIALADRWLFAALAPALVLLAGLASRIPSQAARMLLGAAAAAWVLVMAAAAPRLHAPYGDRIGLLAVEDSHYRATPERFRAADEKCRHGERDLIRAASAGDVDAALGFYRCLRGEPGCGGSVNPDLTVLLLLLSRGRSAEALPIAEALAAPGLLAGRFRAQGLALAAEAYHANGRSGEAVALLERAWRETPDECELGRTLARALAAAGRDTAAAAVLVEAERCGEGAAWAAERPRNAVPP